MTNTTKGLRIDGVSDDGEGMALPCRGELRGARCGEPLNEDGSCWACDTRHCECCGLVFRAEDFDGQAGACVECVPVKAVA